MFREARHPVLGRLNHGEDYSKHRAWCGNPVEHLDFLPSESFDAAVMVNVLYALDRPQECLRSVQRILKPGGVLGLSTTHRETNLDPLLEQIEAELRRVGKLEKYAKDWDTVRQVNKELERTVVRKHTREEVREMVTLAGFEITKEVASTYEGAVMLLHARKTEEDSDSDSRKSLEEFARPSSWES